MRYRKNVKRLRSCSRAALAAALLCLVYLPLGEKAWPQTRDRQLDQLKGSIFDLQNRVSALERFLRSIACGRVDAESLNNNAAMYSFDCDLARDRNRTSVEPPRLKATLKRPGVFSFEFDPPKSRKPLVFVTALNHWASVPVEIPSLHVTEVTEAGFTVETFDASVPVNPSNVDFFFIVLTAPPTQSIRRSRRNE